MRTVIVLSSLLLLSPAGGRAQGDMGFASRLPASTSFYVTTEHLGDVAAAVAASNFYRRVYAIPSVADAVERGKFLDLAARWNELLAGEQGPTIRAVASLAEREVVFASTGDGSRGLVPGIIQLARIALLSQEYKMGGMSWQVGDHVRDVAAGLGARLGLESFALAFRTAHRATLEPLVEAALSTLPPTIAPMLSVEEIHGVPFTTLTVVPAMFFPPDRLRASLAQIVGDSLALDSVVATYRDLTLKVRLAWIGEYLIVVAEDRAGTLAAQLAHGPQGGSLADLREFRDVLARSGTHPVRRVVLDLSGWRANLANQLAEVAADLRMCRTLMGFAAGVGLTADVLGQKLQEFAASSLDPVLSVASADLDEGVRMVADLRHVPESRATVMGSKRLGLTSHVPASALGWAVWGGPQAAEAWRSGLDEAVKWRSMPWSTMSVPPAQRAVQNLITDMMTLTRDSLPPALGQEGMVVVAWDGVVKRIKDREVNLVVPELAVVLEINDRDRIRSLGPAYASKISLILSQTADSAVQFPPPRSLRVRDGERIWWDTLPIEGTGVVPTVYLTKDHLIASSSARLAEEVYETVRGKGITRDWPRGELTGLLGAPSSCAGVMLVSEMAARMVPLIDHALSQSTPEASEQEIQAGADVEAALRLLDAIPMVWGHVVLQGPLARVTGRMVIRDIQ